MPIFKRRSGSASSNGSLRLYYASDIHGTEVLWRKFLHAPRVYEAPVIVMGGDVTGKAVIPLVEASDGVVTAELFGQPERAATPEERAELEHRIRSNGMYPHLMTADEVQRVAALSVEAREAWFAEVMLVTFDRWLALAEERLEDPSVRCFVMPGNDDPPGVDDAIERATRVEACDERIIELGGYSMISLGYSNITPFDSPRELEEDRRPLHLQPARPALRLAAGQRAAARRRAQGGGDRRAAEHDPGRIHRGARIDRAVPAPGRAPWTRPRVARGDANRADAVHQSGQRLPHRTHLGRARASEE
jgi:Icc-related predicted phosphoesterase